MMQLTDMKGIIMNDGNGGKLLCSGIEIAKNMTEVKLGTAANPSSLGSELVTTVTERIPGLTAEQAHQLITAAYNDKQLYYSDNDNWSNYIGWYADANGKFAGFRDKDSGYENAPQGAVYANRSYWYFGANGNSDMMHAEVLVRTNLSNLNQTVIFKIPAAFLPLVQYKIVLDKDDPTKVEKFERINALPIQLAFEVGLHSDVNSVNLESKIKDHIQNGGHVHRNLDGTVTFYTNKWDVGNDNNNDNNQGNTETGDMLSMVIVIAVAAMVVTILAKKKAY